MRAYLVYLAGFEIAASTFYGAIAQLGERLICIQEVRGSIPRSSTMILLKVVVASKSVVSGLYDRLFTSGFTPDCSLTR